MDGDMAAEIQTSLEPMEAELSRLQEDALFSGEYDAGDAVVTIQSDAGGTDAQDFTEMLLRMYLRWAADRGFNTEVRRRARARRRASSRRRSRRAPRSDRVPRQRHPELRPRYAVAPVPAGGASGNGLPVCQELLRSRARPHVWTGNTPAGLPVVAGVARGVWFDAAAALPGDVPLSLVWRVRGRRPVSREDGARGGLGAGDRNPVRCVPPDAGTAFLPGRPRR